MNWLSFTIGNRRKVLTHLATKHPHLQDDINRLVRCAYINKVRRFFVWLIIAAPFALVILLHMAFHVVLVFAEASKDMMDKIAYGLVSLTRMVNGNQAEADAINKRIEDAEGEDYRK